MKWKVFLGFYVCYCLWESVSAQEEGSGQRRKKLRKKVDGIGNLSTSEDNDNLPPSEVVLEEVEGAVSAERAGRGFLDEYYSRFEDRVQESLMDKPRANERMDTNDDDLDIGLLDFVSEVDVNEKNVSKMIAEHRNIIPGVFRTHPQDPGTSSKSKAIKKPPAPDKKDSGLVQKVNIPKQKGSEAFMISAIPITDFMTTETKKDTMTSGMEIPDFMTTKTKKETMTSGLVPPLDKYEMTGLEPLLTPDKSYNSIGSIFDSDNPTLDTRDAMSKFFGLTGTTSKDVQLGLTFTVPFMSIPLTAISNMMNGQGLSDMSNLNFAPTTTIITVIILGVILIFVLPQIISWLTGINLSAFNWGRNDDEHGIQLSDLARNVDEALLKYDIDVRNCLARSTCYEYQKRAKDSRTASRISRGLMENLADNHLVKLYLGETRLNDALEQGSSDKDCSKFYPSDVCPWDSSAVLKIVTKLMTSGNVDLASIAAAAAATPSTSKS